MKRLQGLVAAPHTPFNVDGSVNLPVIDAIADHLVSDGVTGVYLCGTTGEGLQCSVSERKAIVERWVTAIAGRMTITVHTGALSITDAIELTQHAETLDIHSVSLIGPCFFKPANVCDLVKYCAEIAKHAPTKGFYYYHSGMSGVNFDMEEFLIEANTQIPTLFGVKFNSQDLYMFKRCVDLMDGKFDVLAGVDEALTAFIACGAKGAVGSTFNYAAPLANAVLHNTETAAESMKQIIDVVRVLVQYGGVQGGKAAMAIHGIDVGNARLPISTLTNEAKVAVVKAMINAGVGA